MSPSPPPPSSRALRSSAKAASLSAEALEPLDGTEHEVGQPAALPALVAEQQVGLLRLAVVEMRVAVPREADATVDLDALAGDVVGRFARVRLGHGRRLRPHRLLGVGCPCCVLRADTRELEP